MFLFSLPLVKPKERLKIYAWVVVWRNDCVISRLFLSKPWHPFRNTVLLNGLGISKYRDNSTPVSCHWAKSHPQSRAGPDSISGELCPLQLTAADLKNCPRNKAQNPAADALCSPTQAWTTPFATEQFGREFKLCQPSSRPAPLNNCPPTTYKVLLYLHGVYATAGSKLA